MADVDTFDFIITDHGDVMLIIYARETEPHPRPVVRLNPSEHLIEFYRTDTESMTLENVSDDVFKNLDDKDSLLVCEINPKDSDNQEEAEIVYTYEAEFAE
ncbi:MAG: hypothetical protein MJ212_03875 [Alphaproteobacteria bacterium]|nr:hypothetical protein [Alphaproteobacteria bacterium]